MLAALGKLGFGFAQQFLAKEVARKPVTMIGDNPNVDILTVAWSVRYAEAREAATTFALEGVPIPTASLEHLIQSKRTGRLQDAADIEFAPLNLRVTLRRSAFESMIRPELELVAQCNLAGRMRAAGAGIGAFFCPTGVGTPLADGKESREIDGRTYVLEYPIHGDVALVGAHRAERVVLLAGEVDQRALRLAGLQAGRGGVFEWARHLHGADETARKRVREIDLAEARSR